MRRMWKEIKEHQCASAVFMLYWLAVYGLYLSRWNAPKDTPDLAPPVLELHFLLPVVAGALVCFWRRGRPGRITGGVLAGAAVFALDIALVLAYGLILNLNSFWEAPSGSKLGLMIEHVAFEIAAVIVGALLGLTGASGSAVVGSVLGKKTAPGGRARSSRDPSQI